MKKDRRVNRDGEGRRADGDREERRVDGIRTAGAVSAAVACVCGLVAIFLAFHLPYLPKSLEDLDSVNFALGVRHFDVARHQPHPPGYPVYIAAAKAVHVVVADEARALGLLSVLAGTLGVIAIAALFRRLDGDAPADRWTVAGTALAMTAPLYWFTAARPLSDMSGLAASLAVQAATLTASTPRGLAGCAFAAGLASGLRSQVAWLTVPLLVVRALVDGGSRVDEGSHTHAPSPRPVPSAQLPAACAIAFTVGILLWFVPLVVITGGPAAYWRALSNQGAEDLGNISMLWTTHTVRAAAEAAYYRLIAPWATWTVAIVVLALAVAGLVMLAARRRRALAMLAAAFGPYVAFDLLFQETFTGRYALPLVVPLAYLVVTALRALPWQTGLVAAVALSMFDAHVSGTSIAAFSREKAPAFRLLDDMGAEARTGSPPPVLAMDRRNLFDFRRPIVWTDGALPTPDRQLPAPPQHEWLEAVKYWNAGGRAPVWFVVDPKRAAIDLVQHGDPVRYRWPLPYPDLVSGARPDEMDWYRVERPEWYVGEGWALTPEAAGVADADRRDLSHGSIDAWISSAAIGTAGAPGALVIGGRSFDSAVQPRLSVALDGRSILEQRLAPGPFLRSVYVPPTASEPTSYARLTVSVAPAARVAVEQFDVSSTRPVFGFGDGWHEQEFNPRTGLRWRWLSERGALHVTPLRTFAGGTVGRTSALGIHIEGESPLKYFSRPSALTIRMANRVLASRRVDADFSFDVPVPADVSTTEPVVFETDQAYVPAERSRRTQDRRHLGLRIFRVRVYERDTATSSRPAR